MASKKKNKKNKQTNKKQNMDLIVVASDRLLFVYSVLYIIVL